METLKKLATATVLMCVLGLSAFAGDTMTPPCAPGEISTPPCAMAQAPTPGETSTPPAGALGQLETPSSAEVSLTEIASYVLLSIVSLF